ncbi:hypothetical protein [Methylobacillus flagellatus]|uniref:hypothetical protein n=1 Tax=Methylobacillus flagellatus TaxID=405 RepID=UPI00286881B0|nr:hypothetical protein [Methylobacillus flagellatus]
MGPGEKARRKRKRERELAKHTALLAGLRTTGARCETCAHRGHHSQYGVICELKSDWEGYVRVDLRQVCTSYAARGGEDA